jgi:hypothetical protein
MAAMTRELGAWLEREGYTVILLYRHFLVPTKIPKDKTLNCRNPEALNPIELNGNTWNV